MEMPGDKFVRGPFNWIDVLAITIILSIMAFSVMSGIVGGE